MLCMRRSYRYYKNLKPSSCSIRNRSDSKPKARIIADGPTLKDFIVGHSEHIDSLTPNIPYIQNFTNISAARKVYFDVFGCQMNLNDTEIVWSILKDNGFIKTEVEEEADVFLVMTCAIRENAENKIWHRLDHLRGYKRRRHAKYKDRPIKIGILGCMAERLKEKLIDKEKAVDLVAGPDSYRDLPRLLSLTDNGQKAVNVLLSLDETYADVVPVRLNQDSVTAFISIMRGCDNMCTYCIVPFTRGRERSRPIASIVDEVKQLSEQGVKEITLLGQNVNSYRDTSHEKARESTKLAKGFQTVYKSKLGGVRFADLLDRVSAVNPEMRVRFTAAHPKDFPDEVLEIISERPNICKLLHLPAQSGSTTVLQRMRRGYSRDAYLELVAHAKETVPGVGFSTDIICGFCGETDEEFEETMSLMEMVDYHIAYNFIYSMREKTTAYRRYKDDVPESIKKQRLHRLLELYTKKCQKLNQSEIGTTHLVLIEGRNKKTDQIVGRNEMFLKVLLDETESLDSEGKPRCMKPGDYVAVEIVGAKSSLLQGKPVRFTSLSEFYKENSWAERFMCK